MRSLLLNWGSNCINQRPRTKLEKAANFRAGDWFLAGMQLHWFLNQNCNLGLDRTSYKLKTDLYFDISLAPFSFKWNDMFCSKRRRFIHCSLKKKKPGTVPFWRHCGSSSSPGCVRQGKRKNFPPLLFSSPSVP